MIFQFQDGLNPERAQRVETLLRCHESVQELTFDLASGRATVIADAMVPRDLLETLQGNGYAAVVQDNSDPDALWKMRAEEIRTWRHLFCVSFVFFYLCGSD